MIRKILLSSTVITILSATNVSDFINLKTCDQIIDKEVFKICYSYKYKGALAVWYELDGNLINKNNLEERPSFYNEKNIPIIYRSKPQDYIKSGFDKGHLANDANFDYDESILIKTYSMANIVPQYPNLNRHTWLKAEEYERFVSNNLEKLTIINLVDYSKSTQQIGNNITVPNAFYKIMFNDNANFKKCFKYENINSLDFQKDKLKDHQIDCSEEIK